MKENREISFVEQLKKIFILIVLIPIFLMGSFIFYSSYQYVKQQKNAEIANVVEQNIIDLDNRMNQCENSMRYIAGNYSLQEMLQMDENAYLELGDIRTTVGPLLYNTLLSNQYYEKIEIYTEKNFSVMNDLIKNSENVKNKEWYQKTLDTTVICWWFIGEHYYISKSIYSSYPEKLLGVVFIQLKPEIIESSFNVFDSYPIQINLKENGKIHRIYGAKVMSNTVGYCGEKTLKYSKWKMEYVLAKTFFKQKLFGNIVIPIVMICVSLLITWILFHLRSKSLVRELDFLVNEVNEIEGGNLDVEFAPAKLKEINVLTISIEKMIDRIKQLIQQIYTKEIERQDLEINLLQSKISPHFLYNNLSAINWIAIENGQDKIYEITTEMAAFYRSALNKGKSVDKLSVEVSNIKAYINLQLISHENSFDVVYEIDEKLLDQDIPIFILQPLIENAIEHGVDELRMERGLIRIVIKQKQNEFSLCVCDNGKDLYERIGCSILGKTEYGYGTSNVDRRIQLFYGKEYGLTISANEEGTTSHILLKVDGLKNIYMKEFSES